MAVPVGLNLWSRLVGGHGERYLLGVVARHADW